MTVSYYDTWCDWLLPKHSYHCHIWFTSVNPAYSKPATQLEPYQLKYSSLQRVCVSDKRRSSQLHTQVDSHFVVTVWLTVRSDCSSRVIELNDWLVVWQSSLGGGGGGGTWSLEWCPLNGTFWMFLQSLFNIYTNTRPLQTLNITPRSVKHHPHLHSEHPLMCQRQPTHQHLYSVNVGGHV